MGKFTNVLVGALAVLAFSSCAEGKKGYVIDGQVTDVKDGMMYLKKYVGKSFVDVNLLRLWMVSSSSKVWLRKRWRMD